MCGKSKEGGIDVDGGESDSDENNGDNLQVSDGFLDRLNGLDIINIEKF